MLQSEALNILAQRVSVCTACDELAEYRRDWEYRTVPGEGHPNARIMFLGEAPGEQEALSGRPFVGPAGQLLDKIIAACGWRRDDVYITNILKCRPPHNRDPYPAEAAACRRYLDLQIRCINPEWIVTLGRIAAVHLLGVDLDRSMGSLRGEHEWQGRRVLCTYHPSYVLRTPGAKRLVWDDLAPVRLADSERT